MTSKTPCEVLGYEEGDKFWIEDKHSSALPFLPKRTTYTLSLDDGTDTPRFDYNGDSWVYIDLLYMTPLSVSTNYVGAEVNELVDCIAGLDSAPYEGEMKRLIELAKRIKNES